MTLSKCENANCGHDVTTRRAITLNGTGRVRLCTECYLYASQKHKLRPLVMVHRNKRCAPTTSETGLKAVKKRRAASNSPCENPHCKRTTRVRWNYVKTELGNLRLCDTCHSFWKRTQTLRSAEMVSKQNERIARRKPKGAVCHNKNCQTSDIQGGLYSTFNGEYYCFPCAKYVDTHNGEERSPRLIEQQLLHASKVKGISTCENPSCAKTVRMTTAVDVEGKGWMHLCGTCYNYYYAQKKLRTPKMVKKTDKMKTHFKPRGDCCHNPQCKSTDLNGGMHGKIDGEFYCVPCARYVNSHSGEQRPRSIVIASRGIRKKCENPGCDVRSQYLVQRKLNSGKVARLCHTCYPYAYSKGEFRPIERKQKWESSQKPRMCHNENCGILVKEGGKYAKSNGEFYCAACCIYMDRHGEERARTLVEEQRLRHSRYLWQQTHPWEKE